MDSILDALGYVGDLLAKPGRAVRGLLTGNAREGLAALPFSDTAGLTDPTQAVDGKTLLRHLGIDPGDDLGGDAAGFAADVATDPLTFFGGAALNRGARMFARGGLGAGRGASTIAPEANGIFDLVSPADRELEKLLPGNLGRPTAAAAAPSPVAEAAGRAAPLADQPAPLRDALTELPPVDRYAADIAYGPLDDPSIANDLLVEGRKRDALIASLTGWDSALNDIEGLGDAGRKALGWEGRMVADETPEVGRMWQNAMSSRRGDLLAMQNLAPAIPGYGELQPLLAAQLERLSNLNHWSPNSESLAASSDLLAGLIRPSEVATAGGLNHLPLDERALRKMAAEMQQSELLSRITGNIGENVPAGMNPNDALGLYTPEWMRSRMEMALDPDNYQDFEPGILGRMLNSPPADEYGDHIRLAQELLERLSGSRTPYPIPRPPTRG